MKRLSLAALAFLCFSACVSRPPRSEKPAPQKVSIMTYNVENLFDTVDDPTHNDETFLPMAMKENAVYQNKCRVENDNPYYQQECLTKDWSPAVLDRKLKRLTDVLEQVNNGHGPDIVIMEEVESTRVLEQWRSKYLGAMNYTTMVHIKGPDERGIGDAIFSRLPLLAEPKLHEIDFSSIEKSYRPSRGILEAHLKLPNGDPLVVFAVHFPSQGAKTAFRKVASEKLLSLIKSFPPETKILVGGDFNITAKEEWKEKYVHNILAPEMTVSHFVGCRDCAGTIYYPRDKTWSFFDILMFSKNLTDGAGAWHLDPSTIHIVNSSIYQISRYGTPSRFGSGKGPTGVSDHWPMYAELKMTAPAGGSKQ